MQRCCLPRRGFIWMVTLKKLHSTHSNVRTTVLPRTTRKYYTWRMITSEDFVSGAKHLIGQSFATVSCLKAHMFGCLALTESKIKGKIWKVRFLCRNLISKVTTDSVSALLLPSWRQQIKNLSYLLANCKSSNTSPTTKSNFTSGMLRKAVLITLLDNFRFHLLAEVTSRQVYFYHVLCMRVRWTNIQIELIFLTAVWE